MAGPRENHAILSSFYLFSNYYQCECPQPQRLRFFVKMQSHVFRSSTAWHFRATCYYICTKRHLVCEVAPQKWAAFGHPERCSSIPTAG